MDSERTAGIPWIVGTPRTDHGPTDLVALVIARGWADTSIAEAWQHGAVAAVLRRELTRPIEAPGGGVLEADVQVEVGLQDTIVMLTGGQDAVLAAAERMQELLTRPEALVHELPEHTDLATSHPFAGWGDELANWFGVGPASVFAGVVPSWDGVPESGGGHGRPSRLTALHAALRACRPGRSLAAVGATTVAELPARLFADTVPPSPEQVAARTSALQWRTPDAPTIPGPLQHLLSARVPGGVAGLTAAAVLLRTLHRSFDVTQPLRGLSASLCVVGPDQLLTVTAHPHDTPPGDMLRAGVEAAVDTALAALAELSPEVIASALDQQRSEEAIGRRSGLPALALAAIRSGRLQLPVQLRDAAEATSPDDVRAAIRMLQGRILLTRGVAGPEQRERVPKSEIPGGSPKSIHSPTMPTPTPAGPRFVRVLVNGRRLTQQRSLGQRGISGSPQTVMDLDRVVARLDTGQDATLLIDDRNRRIQLHWTALGFPRRLRRILDAAVPADRVATLQSDGRLGESLRAYRRRAWRIVFAVFGGLAVVGLVLLAIVLFSGSSSDSDEPGAIIDTTIGQIATLPNGTTITVIDPRVIDDPRTTGGLLLADVRYCAGTVQPSDERDYEIRNYVDSSKFALYGTDNNRSNYQPPGVRTFEMTTLAAGECLQRTLVYEVLPANLPEAGMYIQFSNVVNDQVTWRGVNPTR